MQRNTSDWNVSFHVRRGDELSNWKYFSGFARSMIQL